MSVSNQIPQQIRIRGISSTLESRTSTEILQPTCLKYCCKNKNKAILKSKWNKILNLIRFPLEKIQNREEHIKLFCEDAVRKIQIVGNNRINASALSEYMGGIKDWEMDMRPPGSIQAVPVCWPCLDLISTIKCGKTHQLKP